MAARPSTPNLICLAKVRVAPTLREALLCREERETARLVFAEADSIMVKEEFKNEVFSNEIMWGDDEMDEQKSQNLPPRSSYELAEES